MLYDRRTDTPLLHIGIRAPRARGHRGPESIAGHGASDAWFWLAHDVLRSWRCNTGLAIHLAEAPAWASALQQGWGLKFRALLATEYPAIRRVILVG